MAFCPELLWLRPWGSGIHAQSLRGMIAYLPDTPPVDVYRRQVFWLTVSSHISVFPGFYPLTSVDMRSPLTVAGAAPELHNLAEARTVFPSWPRTFRSKGTFDTRYSMYSLINRQQIVGCI